MAGSVGPGKYDPECTLVRQAAEADCVILVVISGNRGHGFSVQCEPLYLPHIPRLLRQVAGDIETAQSEGEKL